MKILGINEGHNSSASLIIDGEVIAAMSEERFSRNKNECGYPEKSIAYCLKKGNISTFDLDIVAMASNQISPTESFTKKSSRFKIGDYIKEQYEYWKPTIGEGKKINYYKEFIKKHPEYDKHKELPYDFSFLETEEPEKWLDCFKEERLRNVIAKLGISEDKVIFVDHHTGHASYAYYASPLRDDVLVVTVDAWGDGANCSYGFGNNNKFKIEKKIQNNHLARLYRWGTLLLGMKPDEHEYKVMGLAPYAKEYITKKPFEIYSSTLVVDGDNFKWANKPRDMYFWFKDQLEGCRFDGIAAGLQRFVEVRMTEWIRNILRNNPMEKIVFSGGLALNVKVNKKIAEMEEISDIHVPPSGGDESLAIGAAYHAASEYCEKNNINKATIKPLKDAYLGPEFTDEDVEEAIKKRNIRGKYTVIDNVTSKDVAKYLTEGKIVARFYGRMEFGARALGNRSILADPSEFETIKIINEMVKSRDFWMPFTPSILEERTDDYLENPKRIMSPYMTIGYESTDLGRQVLKAAIHPYDKTVRPQFVDKEINPEYHELISEFEKLTGIGALLNTSLNLHGEPMACSPEDALHVFENSKLDIILMNNTLVMRDRQ